MNTGNDRGFGCFVTAVSGIALLFALIALRRWDSPLFQITKAGVDVVNVLSLLVVILIGWQVFNAIENVKTFKRIDEVQSRFESQSRLLELQNVRTAHLLEALTQTQRGDREEELSAKYLCYLNAIYGLVLANVPSANLYLIEVEGKLELTLSDIEKSKDNLSRSVFASHIQTYEDTFRKMMTHIHQRQEDIEALHTRIIRLRDKRRQVCESIK